MTLFEKFRLTFLSMLVASAAVLTDVAVAAGDTGWTHVERAAIASNMGNVLYIRVGSTPTTPAACSTHSTWHFTLNLDTAAGKSMYALLLEARASGRQIWLSGANTCSQDSTVESLRSLTVDE